MAAVPKTIDQINRAHAKEMAAIEKRHQAQHRTGEQIRAKGQGWLVDQGQADLTRKREEDISIANQRRDKALSQAQRAPARGKLGMINWANVLRGE